MPGACEPRLNSLPLVADMMLWGMLSSFTKVKNHYDAGNGSGTSKYMNDDDSQELDILYIFEGTSTTYPFESAAGSWIYISGKGDYANLSGAGTVTFNLNASDFSALANATRRASADSVNRLSFTPLPNGTVRQHGEQSTDHGKTWTTLYDLYYHRRQERSP